MVMKHVQTTYNKMVLKWFSEGHHLWADIGHQASSIEVTRSFIWLHFKSNYRCGAPGCLCCTHILGGGVMIFTSQLIKKNLRSTPSIIVILVMWFIWSLAATCNTWVGLQGAFGIFFMSTYIVWIKISQPTCHSTLTCAIKQGQVSNVGPGDRQSTCAQDGWWCPSVGCAGGRCSGYFTSQRAQFWVGC